MSASQYPPSSTPDSKPPVTLKFPTEEERKDEPKSPNNGNTLEELEETIKTIKGIFDSF